MYKRAIVHWMVFGILLYDLDNCLQFITRATIAMYYRPYNAPP